MEATGKHFGLRREELRIPVKGDLTRVAIACLLFHETTISQGWIAEHLGMKSAANVGQQLRQFRELEEKKLPAKIRRWKTIKIC